MTIDELFAKTKTVAVVGVSPDSTRSSHSVAIRMLRLGITIIPVNPTIDRWEGLTCYPTVTSIPEEVAIDIVDVFRREEFIPEIIADSLSRKHLPTCVWLQQGLRSVEGRRICEEKGVFFVEDACLAVDYGFYLSSKH